MKKIIFDIDDILWSLNAKAAKMANLDYNKLTSFALKDNDNLSADEANALMAAYNNPDLFKDIQWFDGIERLNDIDKHPNAEIHIVSNIFMPEIDGLKREALHKVLTIPDDRIHLNLVTDATKKELPNDTFILVDDSPYNIAASPAIHNILLTRPWNQSDNGKAIIGTKPVKMFDTLHQIIDYIETLL